MAERTEQDETPIELRKKIAQSRDLVRRDMRGLHYELDFPLKFKEAFQRNTVAWVGGALAVGLLIALLRARPQKVYLGSASKKVRSPRKSLFESGLLFGALKLGISLAQPMVLNYLKKKASGRGAPIRRPGER